MSKKSEAAAKKSWNESVLNAYYAQLDAYAAEFHPLPTVVRETEKAVAVEAAGLGRFGGDYTATVWFPKSLLDEAGRAPGWMILRKMEEISGLHDSQNCKRFGFVHPMSVRQEADACVAVATVLSALNH